MIIEKYCSKAKILHLHLACQQVTRFVCVMMIHPNLMNANEVMEVIIKQQ